MNELKDAFAGMLEEQTPLKASGEQMVTVAKRAERRHRAWMSTMGVGLTVLAVVAGAAVVGSLDEGPASVQSGAPLSLRASSPAGNADDVLDAIAAALPPGYTIRTLSGSHDPADVRPSLLSPGPDSVRRVSTNAVVYFGNRAGEFRVAIFDYRDTAGSAQTAQPTGDLCANKVFPNSEDKGSCRTIMVDGVPVRYATEHLPNSSNTACAFATRYAPGVVVIAQQCHDVVTIVPPDPRPAGLTTLPLTDQQFARFVADPALLG